VDMAINSEIQSHWEKVYSIKQPGEVSWYQPHLRGSLELIRRSGISLSDRIIDVGAGASTLVDDLIEAGFQHLTVLDVSANAIDVSRKRMGKRGDGIEWLTTDVLTADLPKNRFRLWHDRALFHFLTNSDERKRYIIQAAQALTADGFIVIATFSEDGPQKCSGLDTCRYSENGLTVEFGSDFRLIESFTEEHSKPAGGVQSFRYFLFQRTIGEPVGSRFTKG